jgi:hypothetical protein
MGFLAAAEGQMGAEVHDGAVLGQGLAIDEFRPRLGQRPFVEGGKFFVKFAGEDELQDGVAEKLEPLVGLRGRALLVGDRRVRERELEQFQVAKCVSQFVLEFLVLGHGKIC